MANITKHYIKQLIKEELNDVLKETLQENNSRCNEKKVTRNFNNWNRVWNKANKIKDKTSTV